MVNGCPFAKIGKRVMEVGVAAIGFSATLWVISRSWLHYTYIVLHCAITLVIYLGTYITTVVFYFLSTGITPLRISSIFWGYPTIVVTIDSESIK